MSMSMLFDKNNHLSTLNNKFIRILNGAIIKCIVPDTSSKICRGSSESSLTNIFYLHGWITDKM